LPPAGRPTYRVCVMSIDFISFISPTELQPDLNERAKKKATKASKTIGCRATLCQYMPSISNKNQNGQN